MRGKKRIYGCEILTMSLHLSCDFSHDSHSPLSLEKYSVHLLDKSTTALACCKFFLVSCFWLCSFLLWSVCSTVKGPRRLRVITRQCSPSQEQSSFMFAWLSPEEHVIDSRPVERDPNYFHTLQHTLTHGKPLLAETKRSLFRGETHQSLKAFFYENSCKG